MRDPRGPPAGREGVLWYSTDGSDPVIAGGVDVGGEDSANLDPRSGTIYTGPFTITESTRVRATFVEPGLERSVPVEARFLERHAIGPGEWTADAAGARAAAAADPDARLVAVLLSEGRTDEDCEAFLPVSRDPAFLEWCRTNGVYLVVSDVETQAESIAAGDWFWALHGARTDDPVAHIPGIYFVRPSDLWTPLAEGIAIADGAHSVGSVVYGGTAESLVAGFASVLETERTAPRLKPVYRFYAPSTGEHFFTIREGEKEFLRTDANANRTWKYEGVACYAYPGPVAGTVPLYRFHSARNREHFYTANEGEMRRLRDNPASTAVWRYEGVAYCVSPSARIGTTPAYRFWSPTAKRHFFTAGKGEADHLLTDAAARKAWTYEGVAFHVWPDAGRETVGENARLQPVFRFYSPSSKCHFFTLGEAERFHLRTSASRTWNYEGVAFRAYRTPVEGTVPVYRFRSPGFGEHFFTASESERAALRRSPDWNEEGIAFHAAAASAAEAMPVHRFFSLTTGRHFFTAGPAEAERLRTDPASRRIWRYEGVAFRVWPASKTD